MNWDALYPKDKTPREKDFSEYTESPLFDSFNDYMKQAYDAAQSIEYSGCGMRPGWNIKYQKASRGLCTIYPAKGIFTVLVVIGTQQEQEAELVIQNATEYTKALYANAKASKMGRWLMMDVADEAVLTDVKRMIATRRKPRAETAA